MSLEGRPSAYRTSLPDHQSPHGAGSRRSQDPRASLPDPHLSLGAGTCLRSQGPLVPVGGHAFPASRTVCSWIMPRRASFGGDSGVVRQDDAQVARNSLPLVQFKPVQISGIL
jgi:hypothetical protein